MTSQLPIWTPYCGVGATPADLVLRWNDDPVLLAGFALLGLILWRRRANLMAWSAVALAAVLFLSPLCALSSALFSARTVHHVLLVAALAPLAAWSGPRLAERSLPLATAASAAMFWAWHAPEAYAWAMRHDAGYWIMQLSLIGTATWFWAAVRATAPLAAVGGLLVATVQMGLLGAVLTMADRAVYAPHASTTSAWGLTPLQDQQAAGLIMWAPAAAVYLAVAIGLLGRRLRPSPAAT